jgi:hypothetical protein
MFLRRTHGQTRRASVTSENERRASVTSAAARAASRRRSLSGCSSVACGRRRGATLTHGSCAACAGAGCVLRRLHPCTCLWGTCSHAQPLQQANKPLPCPASPHTAALRLLLTPDTPRHACYLHSHVHARPCTQHKTPHQDITRARAPARPQPPAARRARCPCRMVRHLQGCPPCRPPAARRRAHTTQPQPQHNAVPANQRVAARAPPHTPDARLNKGKGSIQGHARRQRLQEPSPAPVPPPPASRRTSDGAAAAERRLPGGAAAALIVRPPPPRRC